ncbi:hypothetical protein MMC28_007299 [Mycoblastus sanguinarius]|nr:hypothetical protein [Mycoblastus sanguinarius]
MATREKTVPPGVRDPALRKQPNPILKDELYIEKYGAETDGVFARFLIKVAPGGGPPLHYHNSYAEHFYPQDGDLGIVVGGETKTLKPGQTAEVPIGTTHRFFNAYMDRDVTFSVEVRPANEGFEKSLHIMYGMARDGGMPKSMLHRCLLADLGDMSSPGLLTLMGPVVKAVAAYARWIGEEERLLQKYWY